HPTPLRFLFLLFAVSSFSVPHAQSRATRTQAAHLRRAHLCAAARRGVEDDVEAPGAAEGDDGIPGAAPRDSRELSRRADAGEGSEWAREVRLVSALRIRLPAQGHPDHAGRDS